MEAALILLVAIAAALAVTLARERRLRRAESSRSRQDVADQRSRRELELKEQSQRTAALFDRMVEGLIVVDAGGRIRLANRAAEVLFGFDGSAAGRSILEATRNHEVAAVVARLDREAEVLGHEIRLDSLEAPRFLQINALALRDSGGASDGAILVFHDLTRLKQLERTREEFVANVSHELRTPLSLIKGYVETLLEGARNNPEVAERFLRIIERNAQRLDLLIQDLLTISALESGRVKLNVQPVELRPLAEKVFTDLKARAEEKDVKLVNQMNDWVAVADAHRLEQVFANLVDNAIKYGRPRGSVTVGGQKTDAGKIEVFVQDDGPGIPPEALDRVFERFYRVDKARSREQGGTGLGLSIVKHIVQNHGGEVWAKSEPGKGATFFFTLPQGQK